MFCKNCGKQIDTESNFCPYCGSSLVKDVGSSEMKPTETQSEEIAIEKSEKPIEISGIKPGIRDWLILVAIGLVISPLTYLYNLFTIYLPIFTNGTWELLTNQNSDYYVSGFGFALTFEIVFHLLFLIASGYLLFFFFKKDKRFPRFYIIYLVSLIIYGLIDYAIVQSMPSFASQASDYSDFGRTILAAIIWIPYMIKSKLVKATFVK